jgi:hypothetical protein
VGKHRVAEPRAKLGGEQRCATAVKNAAPRVAKRGCLSVQENDFRNSKLCARRAHDSTSGLGVERTGRAYVNEAN